MSAYMRALKPGGVLSVTLWNKEEPPKSVLKLYATMAAAARDVDGANIANKFYVVSSYLSTATVLYKRGGFTAEEIAKLNAHTKAMSFDEIYYPGLKVDESELAADPPGLPRPVLLRGRGRRSDRAGEGAQRQAAARNADAAPPPPDGTDRGQDGMPAPRVPATVLGRLAWHYLVNGGWQKVADDYVFDTRILTNHQPYFAAYIKVKDLLKFTDRLELVQDEWGYLLLWATLGIAAIFAFTLVLFPLVFGWRTIFSRYPGKFGTMVYFLCLGLGYIIVEVGMISHFILALSNATVSASVLITGMLVFSGCGSFVSERFLDRARTVMPKIFLAIFLILTLYAFTIDYALDWIGTLPYALRIVLCLLLLLPPAFLMGFPMPTAMTTLGRLGKDHMFLWAWGINGCFSVIGAALVPIVATSFGLPAVVLVGAVAYLVALPAFFSVLMPLPAGAASGRVKRRALLLGALLMPTAARAKRQSRPPRSRRLPKPPPQPPTGPQPLKEAKTQLVAFNASAFPYRSVIPDTNKPFLDARDGKQARPHQPARRRLLGGHDLQRPPLAALSAGRLRSAAPVADRALPARPGRHPRARRDRPPGRAAAACRVGPERRAGGAAARLRCRRFERRQFLAARPFRHLYRRGGGTADAALRRPPRRIALQPGARRDRGL